jgi:hypothetical protein
MSVILVYELPHWEKGILRDLSIGHLGTKHILPYLSYVAASLLPADEQSQCPLPV